MRWLLKLSLGLFFLACATTASRSKTPDQLQWACERFHFESCTELGIQTLRDNRPSQAVDLFQQACDGEHMRGCCHLGELYWSGRGVNQDLLRAESLQLQACDAEDSRCCNNVGLMYTTNLIEGKGASDAKPFFERSCEGGHARGCYNLGILYQKGSGVEKDQAQASALYQQACDAHFSMGCYNLGLQYHYGAGVIKDESKALEFYDKACQKNNRTGCSAAEMIRHLNSCETACGHANELLQNNLDTRDSRLAHTENSSLATAIEEMISTCLARCIEKVVDPTCVLQTTSFEALGACDYTIAPPTSPESTP